MIEGVTGRPFSATTMPPPVLPFASPEESNEDEIIRWSREHYAAPRHQVEDNIAKWAEVDIAILKKIEASQPAADQQVLYDARCDNCHKDTKVVFAPDGKRKIYCKTCRKKLQRAKEQTQQKPNKEPQQVSLREAMQKEPTMFHPSKARHEPGGQKRKAVDKQGLKEVLGAALKEGISQKSLPDKPPPKEAQQGEQTDQKGELRPGETLRFS